MGLGPFLRITPQGQWHIMSTSESMLKMLDEPRGATRMSTRARVARASQRSMKDDGPVKDLEREGCHLTAAGSPSTP